MRPHVVVYLGESQPQIGLYSCSTKTGNIWLCSLRPQIHTLVIKINHAVLLRICQICKVLFYHPCCSKQGAQGAQGAQPPTPPAIRGVQFFLFLRVLLLHKKNRIRSSSSCFYQGMRRSRSGWLTSTNKLPKNHFEPPPKNQGYPPYLTRGEY